MKIFTTSEGAVVTYPSLNLLGLLFKQSHVPSECVPSLASLAS
jgi:hypothetical protein